MEAGIAAAQNTLRKSPAKKPINQAEASDPTMAPA